MTEHEQNSKFTKNKRQDGENKMDIQEWIIFAIELIGTVAFSASGAMVGIECSMDIFGVIVLGVCRTWNLFGDGSDKRYQLRLYR